MRARIVLIIIICGLGFSPENPQPIDKNGGDDGTRTRDLCRDSSLPEKTPGDIE
jgi:hypothetical protein